VRLKQSLAAVRHNRLLVLLCSSAVFMLTGMFILQTLQVYYARDGLGNADYQILLTVVSTGAMFLVAPAIPKIVETFGKKRAYVVAGAATAMGASASRSARPRSRRWPSSCSPCTAPASPRCRT
jgi:glucuronide carrier protein